MPWIGSYCADSDYCSDDDEEYDSFPIAPLPILQAFGNLNISQSPRTHVVFVIDISRSMKTQDVYSVQNGQNTQQSRLAAVADCVEDFIRGQVKAGARDDIYTLITFNDTADTPRGIRRRPLSAVQGLLIDCLRTTVPCYGTSYGAGLSKVLEVCQEVEKSAHNVTQHVVVFLSDGRPGDLHTNTRHQEPAMRTLGALVELLGDKLQLHTVGFGREALWWLDKIAQEAHGRFHDHTMPAGSGSGALLSAGALLATFRSISSDLTASRSTASSNAGFNRSSAPQKRVSLEPRTQYIQDGAVQYSASRLAPGTRRIYRAASYMYREPLFNVLRDGAEVDLRVQPFAAGGQRLAHHMFDRSLPAGQQHLVAKPSRFMEQEGGSERLLPAFRCLGVANRYVDGFNSLLPERVRLVNAHGKAVIVPLETDVSFLTCHMYRLERAQMGGISLAPGASPYVYVPAEPFLRGHYVKYNGNNGHVDADYAAGKLAGTLSELNHCIAHAFSHYTHHASGGRLLVCDIQGVGTTYTDPQVNSTSCAYGRSDMGAQGIAKFFATHKCNGLCKAIGL